MFGDPFLDKLFDLVEQTRNMHDETFNYSVIKFIVRILFLLVVFQSNGNNRLHLTSNLWSLS
jgi:hypothetical protein